MNLGTVICECAILYRTNYEASLNFLSVTVSVHGLPSSTIGQDNGNNIQLPHGQNLSKIQNDSRLHINITSNELSTEAIGTSTHFVKTPSTNLPVMHTTGDMLGGFESNSTNSSNVATTVRNIMGAEMSTLPVLTENYTTASPSPSTVMPKYHFNMKILDYILIPVGCVLAIVVSYCMVSSSKLYLNKKKTLRILHVMHIGYFRFLNPWPLRYQTMCSALYELSYQAIWELVTLWFFFSGFNFTAT